MDNYKNSFIEAQAKFKPLILPYLNDYIQPIQIDEISKNLSTNHDPLLKNSVLITENSIPLVNKIIKVVCARLRIAPEIVYTYVFPSMEINAFAISNQFPITIAISAGSISRLDEEELCFVIGHEIGHALIGSLIKFDESSTSLEDMIYARGLEISADRIGLIATKKIDYAFNAILKLLTGLDNKFLKKTDIHKLLSENIISLSKDEMYSSHPPLLIRIKALSKLSISEDYNSMLGKSGDSSVTIEQINSTTTQLLRDKVDQLALIEIDKATQEFICWPMCLLIFNGIKLDLQNLSEKFKLNFSKEDIQKTFNFINSYPNSNRATIFHEKLISYASRLNEIAPRQLKKFNDEYRKFFPTVEYFDIEFLKNTIK